ncbi:MAG TPA: hypothetical protein VGP19_14010 [Candidatus Acidoferrales bacterium]|nr:hypothetical protein [Candidatus Acidoferrales bacterium]
MTNPATLTPVGYRQFETGTLGATDSPEFSTRVEYHEVSKLAVSRRLEFIKSSEPAIHYTVNKTTANGVGEIFLGAQVVRMRGEGAKPTVSASDSRRVYDGGAPEPAIGSPRNSSVFYASADGKGFHYDANAVFNEVLEGAVHRLQFGQTLSISHRSERDLLSPARSGASPSLSCAETPSEISGPRARPREKIWSSTPASTKV